MRETKMNVLSKIKSVFNRKSEAEVISADEVGVIVEKANNKTQLLRWEQVNRIVSFKSRLNNFRVPVLFYTFKLHVHFGYY